MRRIISIILVIYILLVSSGCNSESSTVPTENNVDTVVLTVENFLDYFFLESSAELLDITKLDVLSSTFYDATAEVSIECGMKVPCTPSNVTVTVEYTSYTYGWEPDTPYRLTLNIPVSGNAQKSEIIETVKSSLSASWIETPYISIKIVGVTGAVEIEK